MVSQIIHDWLEEGFSGLRSIKKEIKRKNSTITVLSNDSTPKPLFAYFLEDMQLETDILPEHFVAIEKKILSAAAMDLSKYAPKIDLESKNEETSKFKFTVIEYNRKDIFLGRTMFNLFEMPDTSVSKASAQYPEVVERNELYLKALEKREKCPENFKEESFQTDRVDLTEKQIETVPIRIENKGCMVNEYELKTHYSRSEIKVKPPPKTFEEFCTSRNKFLNYKEFLKGVDTYPEILKSFRKALYVTEKTLNYNSFKNSILEYNNCQSDTLSNEVLQDITEEPVSESKLKLFENYDIKFHLRFHLEKMKSNYRIMCIECSPVNPSIFAVGCGVSRLKEMDHNPRGMVLCWNIHKCGYPEKIYYTEEIVTCLEFARNDPYLIAVGMRYGLIAIFDLRKSNLFSSINNYSSKAKPLGTIKNVRWVKKKYAMRKETEVLLSVSMDGIISCWTPGWTLDGHVLRYTKRGDIAESGQRMVIAVDAAGMSMQVKPDNDETFLVGTIEGQALQAEISDPESYSGVYNCHNGALYDLQWSPLVSNVFVTCGTDRFIHIWEVGKSKPSKSLTLDAPVLKITWSCVKSTLFAAMCEKRILFFDLSIDSHKQVAEFFSNKDVTFRHIKFCPRNNWILVGQSDGITGLYELMNIPSLSISQEEALKNTFLSE